MRASCMTLVLFGCVGGANLGRERAMAIRDATRDGDSETASDASTSPPDASVDAPSVRISLVEAPSACGGCFVLGAEGPDTQVGYTYDWDDGSTEASRRVCPARDHPPYTVTLHAPDRLESASSTFDLASLPNLCFDDAGMPRDAGAAVLPLCLNNGSFEPTAAGIGSTFATSLGAAPWQICGTPPNFPQLVNTDMADLFMLPEPTEGGAYLSLSSNNLVSETLCTAIAAGSSFSFRVDLAEGSAAAQTGVSNPVLEIWGGTSAICVQDELLWSSPVALTDSWQTFCGTVTTLQPLSSITLRANSGGSLPSPYDVLLDNLQPVAACPP